MKQLGDNFVDRHFFPYQASWLKDTARFKIGLWARQSGKDYTCAAEAVIDSSLRPGTHWVILACGERQATESLQKAREWLERIHEENGLSLARAGIALSATEIRLANGSRITALPARPETVRGYSANVILTEFAFHENPEAIWRAVFPSVSNPLRGGLKKLRVISTPNGYGNFFHDLWLHSPAFSKHKVTIHQALADGLPIEIESLRAGIHNPEAWAQEYECEFLDQTSVLLSYELIESCESAEATESSSQELLSQSSGELFIGIDFGRKNDLSVCWILERLGAVLVTREVLVLERMSTPVQLNHLRPRIERARRVCVDYTGCGVGLGDSLAAEFGEYSESAGLASGRVELCSFTAAFKQDLLPRLRAAFERGAIRIPSSAAIRQDLHGMHTVVSQSGGLRYRAMHTADGHSDRCTALALAVRAAERRSIPQRASSVGPGLRAPLRRVFH